MNDKITQWTDWSETSIASPELVPEILEQVPDLTPLEAYQIQMARMDRAVAGGDRIIGYKAALTSVAMQQQAGVNEPVLGTLLASRTFQEDAPIALSGFIKPTLEPEVAVLLKSPLKGPGVTELEVLAAVAGYLPCVEVGDIRTGENVRSLQQTIVCNTFNGGHVFGQPLTAPQGVDLRYEGMVMQVNGEPLASATAIEVLGDPLRSVAFMANKLSEVGRSLEPGMVLMTGSIVKSVVLQPGDSVQVDFSKIGRVQARFVA